MPKKREESGVPQAPQYLRHRSGDRDRAYTRVHSTDGSSRRVYLGDWNSPESRRRFREVAASALLDLNSSTAGCREQGEPECGVLVAELVARFLVWKQAQVCHSQWDAQRQLLLGVDDN